METSNAKVGEKEVALSQNLGRLSRQLSMGASLKFGFVVQVCLMVFYGREDGQTSTMWSASTNDDGKGPGWAKTFRTFIEQVNGPKDENGCIVNKQPSCGERFDLVCEQAIPMAIAFEREIVRMTGEHHGVIVAVQGSENGCNEVWSAFATNIIEEGNESACAMLRTVIEFMDGPMNPANTPGLDKVH